MKIDLSEFLPKDAKDAKSLDEFLPPELPKHKLSSPELLVLHWSRSTCSCGRSYEYQTHSPTIRHTFYRRCGLGYRDIGKVYIPYHPSLNTDDLPTEVRLTEARIYHCPSCLGTKTSLELFPRDPTPRFIVSSNGLITTEHGAAWLEAHKTAPKGEVEGRLNDMRKREVDFDDLLMFQTTPSDLHATFDSFANNLADPEE